jgi:dolichol-phosphate mannosyltransferase
MRISVVIPCRNEAENLRDVIESISRQDTDYVKNVLLIENNSTDNTLSVARELSRESSSFGLNIEAMRYEVAGNLFSAVEYDAFLFGASYLLENHPQDTHIMKLDADVRLNSDYFRALLDRNLDFDLTGGKLSGEQFWNIPGCIKLYSLRAFEVLKKELPSALGWDVLDEVLLRKHGMQVVYSEKALYRIARITGISEGLINGRKRLGIVCHFTGYSKTYFALKFVRYIFRKPLLIGSIAMLVGYLSRQTSPFSEDLISHFRTEQKIKLKSMIRNPISWIRRTYS